MKGGDLWRQYCSFYDRVFSEQIEENKRRTKEYFTKWTKTDLCRMLCNKEVRQLKDISITRYSDYSVLAEFGQKMEEARKNSPQRKGELSKEYYDRISPSVGRSLDRYMVEPFQLCMKTTGTTGRNKWVAHGKTFWDNLVMGVISTGIFACANSWGDTTLQPGDKALTFSAPVPHLSGWTVWASQKIVQPVPPIAVTDSLRDMKEVFALILRLINKGEKVSLGGGIGASFYMICKHFTNPREFYQEYYSSMDFGLRKILLKIRLLQSGLVENKRQSITELVPLKGVMLGGMETRLYIEFFKKEFGIEPLHNYGSTEAGILMRGDPDRKTDLLPDLRNNYFEFQKENGEIKDLDELQIGETYQLVVTPFGSIFFRYDMEDLVRVVDFRDDGMPIFAFEGRKQTILRLLGYSVTPNIIVDSLARAGLESSDKWAVTKTVGEKEKLCFIMEKTWDYSEADAERRIFNALLETENHIPQRGHTFRDLVSEYRIRNPSELIKVEYIRRGVFTKYSMLKAKEGAPMGQYKPPSIIAPEKREIYETLKAI